MIQIENFLTISHYKSNNFAMPQLHCHNYYEVFLSLVDDLEYIVNDCHYTVMKNDMIILNSNDLHRAIPKENTTYERYVLLIDPEKVLNIENENILSCFEKRMQYFCHKIHLTENESEEFVSILKRKQSKLFPKTSLQSQLFDILIFINEKYSQSLSGEKVLEENKGYQKIQPAVTYINENLSEKLLLETLANVCFMEKTYFCKMFKTATGFTPHEYICYKRVVQAQTYLLQGKSVLEASELVGYQSSTHFSTKFKEYWGFSPKNFKK